MEHAPTANIIECDASSLLTDVHLHQLTQLDWPSLESIRIRACPNLTPFARNYLQMILDKQKDRQITTVRFSYLKRIVDKVCLFRISN